MPRRPNVADHLTDVRLFETCSARDRQTLAKHIETVEFEPGRTIVSQGDAGNAFSVILDGHAVVRRNGRKVGELQAGDYFGELALLDPSPRNADIVAQSHVTVGRLLVGAFRKMLREVPAMNERLLAGLARRVRDADRHAVE
jgi:cAMP-dependent protein kinase regulator